MIARIINHLLLHALRHFQIKLEIEEEATRHKESVSDELTDVDEGKLMFLQQKLPEVLDKLHEEFPKAGIDVLLSTIRLKGLSKEVTTIKVHVSDTCSVLIFINLHKNIPWN